MRLFPRRAETSKLTDEECRALKSWLMEIGQRMPADGRFVPRILDEVGVLPLAPRANEMDRDIAFYAARCFTAGMAARYARQASRACAQSERAGESVNVHAYRIRARYWEAVSHQLAP